MKIKYLMLTAALSLGAVSNGVPAAGTHAGGHGDDGIGVPGAAAKVTRSIAVVMTDNMRFTPAGITVRQGETIRFKVRNSGKVKHELVLGTEKELKEHYEMMKKNPEMEHAEPNMITLAPGKTGEVIWQFTKSGRVDFACLQPGHYDAGMKGRVTVAATGDLTDGEVRKIDKEAKKITIKHGPIRNLDMPAMTMVFQLKDPALLDKVKAGDKVSFRAEKTGGAVVVTDIQVAK